MIPTAPSYLDAVAANSILDARQKYLDGYGYKLGGPGEYGIDVPLPPDLAIDENVMSITFPFADGKHRDGVGDLLEVGGIDVTRHVKNPVVLFDHGKHVQLPIGIAEDPKTREYTVFLDSVSQVATCKAFFYQSHKNPEHAKFCEQLFDMVAKRYVRAGSIGFTVIAAKEIPPNFETGTPKGLHLFRIKMLEASIVVMPANPDTALKMLSLNRVCGSPLSPIMVKALTPYVPTDRKTTVAVPWTGDLSKTDVPPARWRPGAGAMKGKDISELRNKYRKAKGLRRRLKRSSPGASMVYLDGKDLKAAKEMAEGKGVKFTRVGVKGDLEKVKLTGDDESIDAVAKQYGRSIKGHPDMADKTKITKTKNVALVDPKKVKTKELPDEVAETADETDAVMLEDDFEAPQEKYSAQAARRVYEDLRVLMAEYDRMAGPLENDDFSAYFQETLEMVEDRMSNLEALWGKYHSDLPGLDGAPTKDVGGEGGGDQGDEEADLDEMAEEDKEIEGASTEAVPADSVDDGPEDDTTDAESAEVMMEKRLKNLDKTRAKYKKVKKKAMCKDCGKADCKCAKGKALKKELEKKEDAHKALTEDEAVEIQEDIAVQEADTEENPAPPNPDDKGLEEHEVPKVREAHGYLKEMSEAQNFDQEMQMKSYHYHKAMDDIGNVGMDTGSMDGVSKANPPDAPPDAPTGSSRPEWGDEEPFDPVAVYGKVHPHRKMCKDTGGFFRRMAFERSFGDPHRQEALMHHKNLDQMLGSYCKMDDPGAEVLPEAATPEEAIGEVEEKRLGRLESLFTRLELLAS